MSTTNKEAPSLFSSLPDDLVVSVLARVPIRYHPILSCVSKRLQSLVRSSELQKTRSLLGKDCFYVCFEEFIYPSTTNHHWFTLTENHRLVSIPFPSPPEPYANALMVGPEIYFIGGFFNHPTRKMWILDPRSRKLRQGPSSRVASRSAGVGLVDDKIYIFGGCQMGYEEIQAQFFNLKTHTWQIAPNPSSEVQTIWMSAVSPSLDRKIYARSCDTCILVYDPKDGKCDGIQLPFPEFDSHDVCMIDNVLYIHYSYVGLMWYNFKNKEWRLVRGLKLNKYFLYVTMAVYNGKLAFLWQDIKTKENKEIWCAMIALSKSGLEIQGRVEWSNCVHDSLPSHYNIKHYLGRTD